VEWLRSSVYTPSSRWIVVATAGSPLRSLSCTPVVPRARQRRLSGASAGRARPMLATVLHEPEHVEPPTVFECVERDLGRKVRPVLGPAGELDRRAAPLAKHTLEELADLRAFGRVNVRDRG